MSKTIALVLLCILAIGGCYYFYIQYRSRRLVDTDEVQFVGKIFAVLSVEEEKIGYLINITSIAKDANTAHILRVDTRILVSVDNASDPHGSIYLSSGHLSNPIGVEVEIYGLAVIPTVPLIPYVTLNGKTGYYLTDQIL